MQNEPAAEDVPFKGTEATNMLKAALDTIADERGLSNRAVARQLGYKATVVISHMATGRVPIPLERAVEIASVVGLDPRQFFLAVLEQRHPGSMSVLGAHALTSVSPDAFSAELEVLAGSKLGELPEEHKRIIREVVSERAPARRWLSIAELPTILLLRRLRPEMSKHGMPRDDLRGIEASLEHTP
jgi:hypothetical protein